MNNLLDRSMYLNKEMPFIISSYIREYDMTKANINILLYKECIDQKQFKYYSSLDKIERQILIGNLSKDEFINNSLSEGFKEFRNKFLIDNNIPEYKVLSIKKDAIILIDFIPNITKFSNVEFVLKNIYTSFYLINKIEYYYSYDQITKFEQIDIKGIKDNLLYLHRDYFLEFLLTLFNSAQTEKIEDTINLLYTFYNNYINRILDVGYYRNFDSSCKYILLVNDKIFEADTINEKDKRYIDISCNLNILRELSSYYINILNKR